MAKDDRITVRVDSETRRAADELFRSCGISMAAAINLFLHRSVQENGLPFPVEAGTKTQAKLNNP